MYHEIMKIDILTLFPEMFDSLKMSILGRAISDGKIDINVINIRDFSKDKHKKCDDEIYGGGAGMLMMVQPIYDAVMSVKQENSKIFMFSPKGEVFNQKYAEKLKELEHIILICGHYEGIDERIVEIFKPNLLSMGDFVLTGGEIPAMLVVDCVARLVDNVISKESLSEESFSNNLLEYPQYTRPADFMGYKVPDVLLSGNHAEIDKFRKQSAIEETKKYRPDLLD